jgi:hypothetical protein
MTVMIEALFLIVPAVVFIGGLFLLKGEVKPTPKEDHQLLLTKTELLSQHQLVPSELDFILVKHARVSHDEPRRESHLDTSYVISTTILRKGDNYYLMMISSNGVTKKFEQINELRARRALFNHKNNYLAAFGELPDRKQIKNLLESK